MAYKVSKMSSFKIAGSALLATAIFYYFLSAHTANAAGISDIEPLFKVLDDNKNIKEVWGKVRDLVNIAVVAALIYIAFLNILRINVNNYAVKKFLPSLLLAVILTNFSYFISRIMVDFANVVLSMLIDGAAAKNAITGSSGIGIAGAFDFSTIIPGEANLWQCLFYTLAMFVGGLAILLLAILYFIRNYVIYFLVGIAPLAFMAMSMADTKKFFTQWWSQFMRWVFMPIVSVFWLWLGGVWYSSGFNANSGIEGVTSSGLVPGADFNSNLFAFIFAILCYYLAITTPFKMGGAIMSNVSKYGKQLGKWGMNASGISAGYNYLKAKNNLTWENNKNDIYDRIKKATGIGKGLEFQKARQKDIQTRRDLTSQEYQAEYIKRSGRRRAKEQLDNMSRGGAIESEESKARGQYLDYIKSPDEKEWAEGTPEWKKNWLNKQLMNRRNNIKNQNAKWLQTTRMRTVEATTAMAATDADLTSLTKEMEEKYFSVMDRNGVELTGDEEKERKKKIKKWAESMYQSQVGTENAKKASDDHVKKVYRDRVSVQNVYAENDQANKLHKDLGELIDLTKRGLYNEERAKGLRAKLMANGYDVEDNDQSIAVSKQTNALSNLDDRKKLAAENYQVKVEEIREESKDNGGKTPGWAEGLVEKDANGNIKLKSMGKFETSRAAKWLSAEISSDANTASEKWSMREILHSLEHGNELEGFNRQNLENFFSGNKSKNDAKVNFAIESFVKASTLSNNMRDVNTVKNMDTKLRILEEHNQQGLIDLANTINEQARSLDPNAAQIDTSQSAHEISTRVKELGNASKESAYFKNPANSRSAVVMAVNSSKALGHGGMSSQHG